LADLHTYLGAQKYDPVAGVFETVDLASGWLWECSPPAGSIKTTELETFLADLQSGSVVQLIVLNDVHQKRVLISLKIPESEGNQHSEIRSNFSICLKAMGFHPKSMDGDRYVDFVKSVIDSSISDDKSMDLSERAFSSQESYLAVYRKLVINNRSFRAGTLQKLSECGIKAIRDGLSCLLCINLISRELPDDLYDTCRSNAHEETIPRMDWYLDEMKVIHKALNAILKTESSAFKSKQYVELLPVIWTWAPDEQQLEIACSALREDIEASGSEVNFVSGILATLFISSLPFGMYPGENNLNTLIINRSLIAPIGEIPTLLERISKI